MYDIIGDVHGHYSELHELLTRMGYVYDATTHNFVPPAGRRALFIGDYIDRGDDSIKVIKLVKNMQRVGYADAIMGNHDFNAVLWAMPDPNRPGKFLRSHSEGNLRQHHKFLEEVAGNPDFYREAIEWFKTLPVFLKRDQYCFVHACWSPEAIRRLQDAACMTEDGKLTPKGWLASADRTSPHYGDIELLLKGPDENLPEGITYKDLQGHTRRKIRMGWWNAAPKTYEEAFASLPEDADLRSRPYIATEQNAPFRLLRSQLANLPEDQKVFIGHIWESSDPKPLSRNVCCVDYSVANDGELVAYRIQDGETEFNTENFVRVRNLNIGLNILAPKDDHHHGDILRLGVMAGQEILRIRDAGSLNPRQKTREEYSTVTDADIASDRIITPELRGFFPHEVVISEEDETHSSDGAYRNAWLVDSIDGTGALCRGSPRFGILIARIENGVPVQGYAFYPDPKFSVVYHTGADGDGAFKQSVEVGSSGNIRFGDLQKVRLHLPRTPPRVLETYAKAKAVIKSDFQLVSDHPHPSYTIAMIEGAVDIAVGPITMCDWDLAAVDAIARKMGACFASPDTKKPLIYGEARPADRAFCQPRYVCGGIGLLNTLGLMV